MNTKTALALGISALALATAVQAQVYQWKDANGRTVVSDSPPPGSIKNAQNVGRTAPPATATSTPTDTKSLSERDMDFKKRQQEAKEKSEKEAKEKAAAAERKDTCERAKQSLAGLESGQRMATTNEKGEREFMDDERRQAEIARARSIVASACK